MKRGTAECKGKLGPTSTSLLVSQSHKVGSQAHDTWREFRGVFSGEVDQPQNKPRDTGIKASDNPKLNRITLRVSAPS